MGVSGFISGGKTNKEKVNLFVYWLRLCGIGEMFEVRGLRSM